MPLQKQQPSGYFGPAPEKTYQKNPEGRDRNFIQTDHAAD
jgi:hypothetical protein